MDFDSRNIYVYIIKIFDVLIAVISLAVSLWLFDKLRGESVYLSDLLQMKINIVNIISLSLYLLLYNVTLHSMEIYNNKRIFGWKNPGFIEEYREVSKVVLASTSLLLVVPVIFQRANISKDVILIFATLTCLLTFFVRSAARKLV